MKLKFRVFILAVIVVAVTGQSLFAQDAGQVRQLLDNERYSSAEEYLEARADKEGGSPEINYLLMKIYLDQDKDREAKQFAEDQLSGELKDEDKPLNLVAYARYLLSAGKKQEAAGIFSELLNEKKNLKNSMLLTAMAEVAVDEEAGDAAAALEWLDKAGKKEKNNAGIDILKGLAWRKLGDAGKAYLAYSDAVRKDPVNVRAMYLLGKIFVGQKNPGVYMDYFEKAYRVDSTYAPVLEELYQHYYFRDVRLARKYLEKFVENTDYSLRNDYNLTDIYFLTADYGKAVALASKIISLHPDKAQPRLYKLIAYSQAKQLDSLAALQQMQLYFSREDTGKLIAADYRFMGQLAASEKKADTAIAIKYFSLSAELDTSRAAKASDAAVLAAMYRKRGEYTQQAAWLGKLYQWKENANNIDLFNWGLSHYSAREFDRSDSVFGLYTMKYPEDIYGYYWRAQSAASIDTSMLLGMALPHYRKVAELGEKNRESYTKMLLKAYGYLGAYEVNIRKDYPGALEFFKKCAELDKTDETILNYIEVLEKWIKEKKD